MMAIVSSTISSGRDSEFRFLQAEDAASLRSFLLSLSGAQRRERDSRAASAITQLSGTVMASTGGITARSAGSLIQSSGV
jgi:hypothetical protein